VVQALQEGCGRNQTWTPDLASGGCIFEASQLSWTTGIITAFFVVGLKGTRGCDRIRRCLMILLVLLRSKACRWEFGYVRQPQLVHVLPGGDKSPGRIVKWEELMDPRRPGCRRSIWSNGLCPLKQLKQMAKTAEQEHQAWCELPFRQLAHNFAKNTFGEKSLEAVESAHELVAVYLQTGFPDRAQKIGEVLLQTTVDKFGKEDPGVAAALAKLGMAHGYLGDYTKKKDLLEGALRIQEQHYGQLHIEVAATLTNLASAHGQLGELGRQKDLHERALTIKEQLYGKEHHLVAMTLKGLGIAHAQLGNFSQVKDLFERTLRIEEQHYGQEHPEVAATLTNVGIAHRKLVN